jgi:hypothetical protein
MKKNLLLLGIIFFIGNLNAQDQTEDQKNLFTGNALQTWGIVVAPEISGASIFDENVFFGQLAVGVSLNQNWFIGGYLGQSVEEIRPTSVLGNSPERREIDFYTYGMKLAYTFAPSKLLHISIPLNLGVFNTEMDDRNDQVYDDDDDDFDQDHYAFSVEPGINLELNLINQLRLYSGIRYRWLAADIEREGTVPKPANHLLVQAGLQITLLNKSKK